MKYAKDDAPDIGENYVSCEMGQHPYDSMAIMLGMIERHLQERGVAVEFTDVYPYDKDGLVGLRFSMTLNGVEI